MARVVREDWMSRQHLNAQTFFRRREKEDAEKWYNMRHERQGRMNASENQIVVYQPNETVRLDVRLENETVWLNQSRLAELFGVDRTVVNRHIHNIYKTGELEELATCAKIAQVQNERRRPSYFRRRALRYGGQVGFTKMDAAQIRRIKAAAFSPS